MENISQDTLLRASYLEQQSQAIESSLNFIQTQIKELENFHSQLNDLEKSPSKEVLANIGRGVYLKTELVNKELFVEVGAGVVVKKDLPETKEVIKNQISKFKEAKNIYVQKQEENTKELLDIVEQIESQRNAQNS